MPLETAAQRHLGESILYLSSLLRAQARRIDQYIDYFGEVRHQGGNSATSQNTLIAPLAPVSFSNSSA